MAYSVVKDVPMRQAFGVMRPVGAALAIGLGAVVLAGTPGAAQTEYRAGTRGEPVLIKPPMMVGIGRIAPPATPAPAEPKRTPVMARLDGVWVQGMGFDVTYGGNYDACAKRCLTHSQCVMIEYYRPEKKCNLYNSLRPRLKGGASDVAIRQ